jgi:glutathione synthase/RimK-type ligase-like ATP-grasp enzyme
MKIAIHHKKDGFSQQWINYCDGRGIAYKLVDCYSDRIVKELDDCDALMWHFHQTNCKDVLFAKQLLFSLQAGGKVVYPDFNTAWHFDDKLGQKYLLESAGLPLVPTYVFYNKSDAMNWVQEADFPKVFKLRTGAGSSHVHLVEDRQKANKLVSRAFGKGFNQYEPGSNLRERWRKFNSGISSFWDVLKGVARFGYKPEFDKIAGKEMGYIYFQDYIPENEFDIRVIVIDGKAFAIKRMVRENDFRASGSGFVKYEKENFPAETIQLSFKTAEKLNTQSLALDFVYKNQTPLIVELSYAFTKEVYDECQGYWDRDLNWHEGRFNPQGWMVDAVVKAVGEKKVIPVRNP